MGIVVSNAVCHTKCKRQIERHPVTSTTSPNPPVVAQAYTEYAFIR